MPDRTFKINFPYFILILLFSSIHILLHHTYKEKKNLKHIHELNEGWLLRGRWRSWWNPVFHIFIKETVFIYSDMEDMKEWQEIGFHKVTFWWFEAKPLRLFSCHEAEEPTCLRWQGFCPPPGILNFSSVRKAIGCQGLRSRVLTASATLERSLPKAK